MIHFKVEGLRCLSKTKEEMEKIRLRHHRVCLSVCVSPSFVILERRGRLWWSSWNYGLLQIGIEFTKVGSTDMICLCELLRWRWYRNFVEWQIEKHVTFLKPTASYSVKTWRMWGLLTYAWHWDVIWWEIFKEPLLWTLYYTLWSNNTAFVQTLEVEVTSTFCVHERF